MRQIAIAAVALLLLAAAAPAQAGIRTDNGSLQSPDAITIIQTQVGQAAPAVTREG
ncbi:hypothetical protein [Plastoroseomonas arctica]|uniref:Uncharacterized protein n=1 Tax=Plastoroseomonas arctica TaxID=1509237 RepID=A0AAF1K572_9PROT|nr:hypothetical protein [Plastoroseomonas arctica]MBR0656135.1 hypothetical protein [Plastoroseomonas arctica]